MQLTALCGFALILLFDGVVGQGRSPCNRDQVHCLVEQRCVLRFEFRCGRNQSCGQNETLCGPPHELNCIAGNTCHERNDSNPFEGGANPLGGGGNPFGGGANIGGGSNSFGPGNRDDDDDDGGNPFAPPRRRSRDGEQTMDQGNGFGHDQNATRLLRRRVQGRSFNRSIIEEVIESENYENDSLGGQSPNECGRFYSPGIKDAVRMLMRLMDLDDHCCEMNENPQRFARKLRNISRQFGCPKRTKFCPFRFLVKGNGCIPLGKNCSAVHGNHSDEPWSPCRKMPKKGYKYCKLFNADIPKEMRCSHRPLMKWMSMNNNRVSATGKMCRNGTRFYLSTFDCRPKGQGTGFKDLTLRASKFLCDPSKRLCVGCGVSCRSKQRECPRRANVSMAIREAAINLEPRMIRDDALRNLTKAGWAPFCVLSKTLLARTLDGLLKCFSRDAHCRQTGFKKHINCMAGEDYCQKLHSFARRFSAKTHDDCRLLRTNPVKFEEKIKRNWSEKPWGGKCHRGRVFCPITMRCIRNDSISKCNANEKFCQKDDESIPWKTNHSLEAGDKFCHRFLSPALNSSCSFGVLLNWLERKNKSCSPFGHCCPSGKNFSLSRMRCVGDPKDGGDQRPEFNETKCEDDNHVFCHRQNACLPKHSNCTKPTRFNFFNVSHFANRSGYAALCQLRVTFSACLENRLRKCRQFKSRENGTCSANIDCPEDKEFCPRKVRCVPRGNCTKHQKPKDSSPPRTTSTTATTVSPQCNPREPKLPMLWAGQPLKTLFTREEHVGLLADGDFTSDLQFKRGDADWMEYKGCRRDEMRVVSTDTVLRLSSCAHGFVSFNITSAPDGTAHGQCVNIAGRRQIIKTVGMAVPPSLHHCARGLDIRVIEHFITIREDHASVEKMFSSYVNVTKKPMNCTYLRLQVSLFCRIPDIFKDEMKEAMDWFKRREIGMVITKTDPPARVTLKCRTPQRSLAVVKMGRFFTPRAMCVVHPSQNVVGRLNITVVPACKAPTFRHALFDRRKVCVVPGGGECIYGGREAKLKLTIRPVNDRPILNVKNLIAQFPPVPENVSDIEGKNIKVSTFTKSSQRLIDKYIREKKGDELFNKMEAGEALADRNNPPLVEDFDSGGVGLAITEAPMQKYGNWQYKTNDDVFRAINITPGMVLLVKPTDRIRFKANEGKSWGKDESREKTFFKFRAWDGSDNRTSGYHALNDSFMDSDTAYSRQSAKCIVLKMGCDKVAGSKLQRDKCGVCTRDKRNKCVGCDGLAYSNKEWDECGSCTLRGAGPIFCSNSCLIPSFRDECGICRINDSTPSVRHCHGDCDAVPSECNSSVCVGGNTGKTLNWGKDHCGVCGGNNKCVDCAGVVRGKNETDSCGDCLDPERDRLQFNKCPKILDVDVKAITGDESTPMCLTIAALKKRIECYLQGENEIKYPLTFAKALTKGKKKSKVFFSTSTGMPSGKYALNCTLDGALNEITFRRKILVYNKPRIAFVTPNETLISNATTVTLTGTGFVNTSNLMCILFMENGKSENLDATFVSDTTIVCSLTSDLSPQHAMISVMFDPNAVEQAKSIAKKLSIYDLVPEPTKCVFSEKRNYLFCMFNRPVDCGGNAWKNSSSFFTAAAFWKLSLSGNSKCRCRKGKLLVQLLPDSSLRPGQTLRIRLRYINRQGSAFTKHSSSDEQRQVNVEDSPNAAELELKLSAPVEIGSCDRLTVTATANQRAKFNWSASFDESSSPTPSQTADLQHVNEKLACLSSDGRRVVTFGARFIETGIIYNITCCALEEFSGQTVCSTVSVRRIVKAVPKVSFPWTRISLNPSVRVKLRAKVQAPSCVSPNKRFMVYLWSCNDQSLRFNDESLVLRIGAGQLTAGQVLRCTFTAYVRDDDLLFARASLTIVVKTKKLVAKIKGGEERTISASEEAVCDGSNSKDPNNLPEDPIYLWTCKCKYDDGWQWCFSRDKLQQLILPQKAVVRIPPNTLPADKTCALTLRYFKRDMSASASVYFDVKGQEVPKVKIVQAFSNAAKVKFIAVVQSSLPDLNLEWSGKQMDEDGNLFDIDLKSVTDSPVSSIVKKRPDKSLIRQKVALVVRKWRNGLKLKCKLKVWREEVEASAEDEVKDAEPPIEGRCQKLEGSEDEGISIEGPDFEDPEDEPLEYRCGYMDKNNKPKYSTSWSTGNICENVALPPGDPKKGNKLNCFVQARNTRGGTARTVCPVVVPPQNFSEEDMKNATEKIKEKLNRNEITEVRADVERMVLGSESEEATNDILIELAKGVDDEVKEVTESEDIGSEEVGELLKSLELGLMGVSGDIEEGRKRVSEAVEDKEETAKNLRKLVSPKSSQENGESSRRKRRSANSDDSADEEVEVDAKTIDEVETTLSVFSALIEPGNFNNSSMAVKQELVGLVDDLGRGLCQSLSIGEPALIAESHIVVIRSKKDSFENVDVNFTNTACENCSYAIQESAQVLLGQSVKDLYDSWDCNEDGCNGACVVSAQYPNDLLTTADNGSSISDVVYVKLFNPENAAPLSVSGLVEPVTFRIPLRNYTASDGTTPMCHTWDVSSLSWKTDGVNTTLIPNNGKGGVSVDCKSSSLGFMTVFSVNSSVMPATQNTQSASSGIPTPAEDQAVYIQIKLVAEYGAHISTESSKQALIVIIVQVLADTMDVNASRLKNVDVRPGSILVSFTLIPGGSGESDVTTAASALRQLVVNGNFSMTLADGRTLFADATSFQSSSTPFTTPSQASTPASDHVPSETSSEPKMGMLVAIVLGSLVGLAILATGVVLFLKKRNKFSKVGDSEEDLHKADFSLQASGIENKGVQKEIRKEERVGSEYPMVDLRLEEKSLEKDCAIPDHLNTRKSTSTRILTADTPLPGTPIYS